MAFGVCAVVLSGNTCNLSSASTRNIYPSCRVSRRTASLPADAVLPPPPTPPVPQPPPPALSNSCSITTLIAMGLRCHAGLHRRDGRSYARLVASAHVVSRVLELTYPACVLLPTLKPKRIQEKDLKVREYDLEVAGIVMHSPKGPKPETIHFCQSLTYPFTRA